MNKIKVETVKWRENLWSCYAEVGGGGTVETGNRKSEKLAKRAFIEMANRLGVKKDRYEFSEKIINKEVT